MKVTLNIDDALMLRLEREAARQGRTMSDLVEHALRSSFGQNCQPDALAPLPSFNSGGELVDIADRNALHDAMNRS